MINLLDLNDKTYEDIYIEALAKLPMYSKEWTNHNISDPGITVLQNLASFQHLQQNYINEVTDEVRYRLLKLLGIEAQDSVSSSIVAEVKGKDAVHLPVYRKFFVGKTCFEVEEPVNARGNTLVGIYTALTENVAASGEENFEWNLLEKEEWEKKEIVWYKDCSYLLEEAMPVSTYPFGKNPAVGNAVYFIMKEKPVRMEEYIIYFQLENEKYRNPFTEDNKKQKDMFASFSFECYTEQGWEEIEFRDETCCFLESGSIYLKIRDKVEPAVFQTEEFKGYAVRCILKHSKYDLPPKIKQISGGLVPVVQRDTQSKGFFLPGQEITEIESQLVDYGCITVFAREEEGGKYHIYRNCDLEDMKYGRFCNIEYIGRGKARISFDQNKCSYAPFPGGDNLLVLMQTTDAVERRILGSVFGYDDQKLALDFEDQILRGEFSLLLETQTQDGELEFEPVFPDETDLDKLGFRLDVKNREIVVYNPNVGQDARLRLCDCVLTRGESGNIREYNDLEPYIFENGYISLSKENYKLRNVSPGKGGRNAEGLEELKARFTRDIQHPATAVMAKDYEYLIKNIPGLCIHKVKAMSDQKKNTVKIVVKPYKEERFPKLSSLYADYMKDYISKRKMITTNITFMSPVYVPIHVQGMIYVKKHYVNAREEIEAFLQEELDYINTDKTFGQVICFNDIFHKFEQLPCVEYIYDFKLLPQAGKDVLMQESDIVLADYCLAYPGRFMLELSTKA